MNRYVVTVEICITAKDDIQAHQRVEKALICLEHSLRYANPQIEVTDSVEAAS